MSFDEPPAMSQRESLLHNWMLWVWLGPLLPLAILLLFFMFGGSSPQPANDAGGPSRSSDSGIETAVRSLTRQTDRIACRNALQQINGELNEKPALRPPPLAKEQKDWLRDHIGLNKDELAEVEDVHYTRLDGHHLDRCFLMRDAARALEVKEVRDKNGAAVREQPLDLATRAFAWVMRQVRLRDSATDGDEAPPTFVLRRGWGSAVERALVFLALLEQLGDANAERPEMIGCLLQVPDSAGRLGLWACGVVIGDGKDVYLFDPRLGLPLPGPNGAGVATLAQAQRQPEILAQLNVAKDYPYPITAERAQQAQAQLVCPLSSLSPRMRYLQDKLLAPAVRVRLALDPTKEQARIQAACAASPAPRPSPPGGGEGGVRGTTVTLPSDKTTLLHRFMPPSEGGADASHRKDRLTMALVPWKALPPAFLDERVFPPTIGLGQRVREIFATPFIRTMMDPGHSRDLLLRGRYSAAVESLVRERDHWRNQLQQRANAANLEEKADKWLTDAIAAYAKQVRAKSPQDRQEAEERVKTLWDDQHGWPIYVLINGAAARARNPEVAYQLALCSHEQAEQLQARLDVQTRQSNVPPQRLDVEEAQRSWQTVLNHWKRLEEEEAPAADRAAARRLRGRAESMLGNRQAAIATWKDVSGHKTDLEKLGVLFLAQQLEKAPQQDKH